MVAAAVRRSRGHWTRAERERAVTVVRQLRVQQRCCLSHARVRWLSSELPVMMSCDYRWEGWQMRCAQTGTARWNQQQKRQRAEGRRMRERTRGDCVGWSHQAHSAAADPLDQPLKIQQQLRPLPTSSLLPCCAVLVCERGSRQSQTRSMLAGLCGRRCPLKMNVICSSLSPVHIRSSAAYHWPGQGGGERQATQRATVSVRVCRSRHAMCHHTHSHTEITAVSASCLYERSRPER